MFYLSYKYTSINENYAFYSQDTHSKYVCVLINQQTGRPIDILPSRRYDYLDEYYSKIPKYEKDQVEFIATDMYEPYRRIIRKHFKHSLHVVDSLCKALHNGSYVKQIFM